MRRSNSTPKTPTHTNSVKLSESTPTDTTPSEPAPMRPHRADTRTDVRSMRVADAPHYAELPEHDALEHLLDADLADAQLSGDGSAAVFAGGLDTKVLVLNKLYMAVRVISAKRAFTMLFRDLAEVIHIEDGQYLSYDFASWTEIAELQQELEPEAHDWVSTVRFSVAVPRVIRLLGYDKLPKQGVKLNRRNLFARDKNQCQYCGNHFPTSELSIDHVHPRSQGGGDSWENLVCSCVKCNSKKGGRTPEQAKMKLIRKPKEPRSNPQITVKLGSSKYESWKTFLDNAYWSVELR